ncbi:MAG: transglutaminase-like domain-containing protein, partial [Brachybacterium sp.]|nr:transglutaminase-like domain-containing protein [Brachybacterium sp.]
MSTPAPPPRPRSSRAVDVAALVVLFLVALPGLHPAYGGFLYLATGVVALAMGTLLAVAGARWRFGAGRLALGVVLIHVLLGTPLVTPALARWGVVPTWASLRELLLVPVQTWKAALTVAPPIGVSQGVLGVVWLSMLLLSLISISILTRTRWYLLAWVFPLLLLAVTVGYGTHEATWPLLRGVAFGVVSLAWMVWRFEGDRLRAARSTVIADRENPGSLRNPALRRRVIGAAVILLLATGVALAAQDRLTPPEGTERYALRDYVTPAFDQRQFVTPLSTFRGHMKDEERPMLTVDGARPGELITIGTMDQWDSHAYLVAGGPDHTSPSGAFLRTSPGVDLIEADSEESQRLHVTVEDYRGVWIPSAGTLERIDLDEGSSRIGQELYVNQASRTLLTPEGLDRGDSYAITVRPYSAPSEEERRELRFADIELPLNAQTDGELESLAREVTRSATSDYEQVELLVRHLAQTGYFSHGVEDTDAASLPGHGEWRLVSMLQEPSFDADAADALPEGMIGDQEQYAALAAVMARSIDIPARVVMGFEVPEGSGETVTLTSADATAWIEVNFAGHGWVRFDPTPDEDRVPIEPEPLQVDTPLPQVAQPPPPPDEPPAPPAGAMTEDTPRVTPPEEGGTTGTYVLLAVSPLLLVVLLAALVVAIKAVRRHRRRSRGPVIGGSARAGRNWWTQPPTTATAPGRGRPAARPPRSCTRISRTRASRRPRRSRTAGCSPPRTRRMRRSRDTGRRSTAPDGAWRPAGRGTGASARRSRRAPCSAANTPEGSPDDPPAVLQHLRGAAALRCRDLRGVRGALPGIPVPEEGDGRPGRLVGAATAPRRGAPGQRGRGRGDPHRADGTRRPVRGARSARRHRTRRHCSWR